MLNGRRKRSARKKEFRSNRSRFITAQTNEQKNCQSAGGKVNWYRQMWTVVVDNREREREREREKERVAIVLMMWAVMAWVSQTRHVTPALHQNTAFGSQTLKVILEPRAVCNLSQF